MERVCYVSQPDPDRTYRRRDHANREHNDINPERPPDNLSDNGKQQVDRRANAKAHQMPQRKRLPPRGAGLDGLLIGDAVDPVYLFGKVNQQHHSCYGKAGKHENSADHDAFVFDGEE